MISFDKRLLPAFAALDLVRSAAAAAVARAGAAAVQSSRRPSDRRNGQRSDYVRSCAVRAPCADIDCLDGAFADGLDYPGTVEAPARSVSVELLNAATRAVLATATTDASGNYTMTAPANTSAVVRAKALSTASGTGPGTARWDVRVLDNLGGASSLYAIEGSPFDTGVVGQVRNLRAASGWSGFAGFTSTRAAAPFAILDTLYAAVQFAIAQGDPSLQLDPLEVFWSPENRPTNEWNPSRGWIVTTAYRVGPSAGGAPPGIYVLGEADNDTDEYDQHIIAHEFQHFLEDQVSRSDTPGGPHSLDEQLDPRVAFSEGFANAFSAMVLNDPVYRDSSGASQGQVFRFDVERGQVASRGWFNETSVQAIAWDLFDAANDDGVVDRLWPDASSAPGYDAQRDAAHQHFLVHRAVETAPRHAGRRPSTPASRPESIVATTMDPYATTETHIGPLAPGDKDKILPVYSSIALNGATVRLCGGRPTGGTYNKLGNRRFLRFNVPASLALDIEVKCPATDAACSGEPKPDPDFVLYRGLTTMEVAETTAPFVEQFRKNVDAGDYVLEIYEYSHVDQNDGAVRRGDTCMTVRITG